METALERIENALNSIKFNTKKVLNLDEAAEYTGFSKSTLYKLISNESIPCSRPGGKKIFFDKEELDAWLLSKKGKTQNQILFNSTDK
ncbi:MAG: helix-turn-helix domain-containing protein [Cyclobacteriaceae bacterium]